MGPSFKCPFDPTHTLVGSTDCSDWFALTVRYTIEQSEEFSKGNHAGLFCERCGKYTLDKADEYGVVVTRYNRIYQLFANDC
jgi:hypothetical protein